MLPITSGVGFIIGDVVLKEPKADKFVCEFPVVFKRVKKDDDGQWLTTHEVVYKAIAWDELGVSISQQFTKLSDIELTGEAYARKWTDKEGVERLTNEFLVSRAAVPVKPARGGERKSEKAPTKALDPEFDV